MSQIHREISWKSVVNNFENWCTFAYATTKYHRDCFIGTLCRYDLKVLTGIKHCLVCFRSKSINCYYRFIGVKLNCKCCNDRHGRHTAVCCCGDRNWSYRSLLARLDVKISSEMIQSHRPLMSSTKHNSKIIAVTSGSFLLLLPLLWGLQFC